jgi:hypothetical protein
MMKRVTWFAAGAATGAAGAGYATRKIKARAAQLAPATAARNAAGAVRRRGRNLVEAVRDGREAMRTREEELRARRDGRVTSLDDHLGPDDRLLVDGQPVEPDRVVVLRRVK